MAKKLEKLTLKQEELLKINKEFFVSKFLNNEKIDKQKAIEVITFCYSLIKKECPKIYQVISPMQAQQLANKLKETEKQYYSFGSFMTIYWASFYAYYETFVQLEIITQEQFPKYFELRKFIESNIFMTIEFENAIIVCEKPAFVKKNDLGMHCIDGPAIKWEDGYGQYYINGRSMPSWIFGKITKEQFLSEPNEDIKAGIYEIVEAKGEGSMLIFLDAKEVDRQTIVHTNGDLEELVLYKTNELFEMEEDLNGNSPSPLTWIKMICPSTNSNYLIPSDGSFNNCIDAAKYARPEMVDNNVDYKWSQRN